MTPIVVLLFVGSGAAALIYEVVWFQQLELVIGSSSVSMGVILGTFMGGMCLGSLMLPKLVSPRRHPLHVYAVLELGIGAFGLFLLGAMPLMGRLYASWGGAGVAGFMLRSVVAALCLVPPTFAMGATLPAVARWVESAEMATLGFFYAGNIAGAVVGSLTAGFYLLRVYDSVTATFVAAAINMAVAVTALGLTTFSRGRESTLEAEDQRSIAISRGWGPASSKESRQRTRPRVKGRGTYRSTAAVYAAIALSGFCALTGEVVWTRLLGLLFGATVYTFAIIVAVFLSGLGIGSSIGAALSRKVEPRSAFGLCQALLVVAIAWTAHEISASLPYWPVNPSLATTIGVNFKLDLVRALWAVLPPAIFWGASFPLALAAAGVGESDPGRLVGRVYAANTIGAVAGALLASLVLIATLGSQHTEQMMIAVSALSAAILLVPRKPGAGAEGGRLPRIALALVTVLLAAWLTGRVPAVPGLLVAHGRFAATFVNQQVDVIYVGEGLQSSVAVSRFPNGNLGYHNAGKIQASSAPEDMRLQRMLGHLSTLVPRDPRSVLVIGCGAGVTAGAVSVDPRVQRVTIVEIEPLVPRVASAYFDRQNFGVVHNPKVDIRIDDGRHYLLTTRERFDAITSDPLDPWVKGAAMLYTKEFFETARDHLNPGGVVTLFVQLYDSNPAAVKSELATFFEVFPHGLVAGNTFRGVGYDTVLLGWVEPVPIDLGEIQGRLDRPEYSQMAGSLREVGLNSAVDLFATYAGRASDLKEWLRDASINRDRDLRLQYLAGLGLNMNESDAVYAEMLKHRRFPEGLFLAPEPVLDTLRARMGALPKPSGGS